VKVKSYAWSENLIILKYKPNFNLAYYYIINLTLTLLMLILLTLNLRKSI